jgi:hypothetical protein
MRGDLESDELRMSMFQDGGYVRETGLAVVHQGEYIIPASGSEAAIESMPSMSAAIVNYYFPVEVVIAGGLPDEERAALETRIWESLGDALTRLT